MDSSSFEEEAIVLLAALEDEEGEKKKLWTHDINLERKEKGEFHTLMPQLRLDKKRFYKYFRMDIACFDEILNLIKDDIEKRYTNLREQYQFTRRLKSDISSQTLLSFQLKPSLIRNENDRKRGLSRKK